MPQEHKRHLLFFIKQILLAIKPTIFFHLPELYPPHLDASLDEAYLKIPQLSKCSPFFVADQHHEHSLQPSSLIVICNGVEEVLTGRVVDKLICHVRVEELMGLLDNPAVN